MTGAAFPLVVGAVIGRNVQPDDNARGFAGVAFGDREMAAVDRQRPPDVPWPAHVPLLVAVDASRERLLESHRLAPRWWLSTPAECAAAGELHTACTRIGTLLVDLNPLQPFEQLIPSLPRSLGIEELPPLGTRASNAVMRAGMRDVGELGRLTVTQLWGLRQVGYNTVTEIVTALVQCAATAGRVDQLDAPPRTASGPPAPNGLVGLLEVADREPRLDPRHAEVLDDLATVARWRRLLGSGDEPLFHLHVDDLAPDEVQEAQLRLGELTAATLVPPHKTSDAVADLEEILGRLDDRDLCIARRRMFAAAPETLDTVGRALGVTRERVRQLERRLRERLAPAAAYGTATGDLMALIRASLRPVAPLTSLVARHPVLAREVPAVGQPLWRVLDRLDDAFEVADGWAAAPTVNAAVGATTNALEDRQDRYGVVRLDDAVAALPGLTAGEGTAWLAYCGFPLLEGHVLLRSSSIPDRVVALLSIAGQPLELDELAARATPDRAVNSVRNALAADDRTQRTGRDKWALADWGLQTYSGIRDLVGKEIDAAGGAVALDALSRTLHERFDIAPGSVVAYASAPPYEVRGGTVRRREFVPAPTKTPLETARLYRHGGCWMYRFVVTSEHLRGSGFPVPVGVAAAAGCERGHAVELASPLGPQAVRWSWLQPSVSSIRRFLERDALAAGRVAFLAFTTTTFDVVAPAGLPAAALDRATVLAGYLDGGDQPPLTLLAAAVGLTPPVSRAGLLDAFRERGDKEVVELLTQAWDELADAAPSPVVAAAGAEADVLKLLGFS